ncbi:alpha/beta-hydrolase [Pluteus cervinus]|uniref:Alpha/beta-hydrolase n=1 Tax=Pluteus cervinus TaxID=181527 RepID=A0ACD3A9L3_9AGAR|nr:alpha/beta-hydrolase [Pluteus cervinus]
MKLLGIQLGACILSLLPATVSGRPAGESGVDVDKRAAAISTSVYDDLVYYFRYASSTYVSTCSKPNGNTLITRIHDPVTDTQGFIVRDDKRKEFVAAFRGSTTATDWWIDASLALTKFVSTGVNAPAGASVHTGWLAAWNSVATDVIDTIREGLEEYPGYSIATTGHSLGGTLSSIAAISLKQNFQNVTVRMFTYGQPRTGNSVYADFVNQQLGSKNIFRGVHTLDGAPTMIPITVGYRHHGVEYWQYLEPSSPFTVRQCNNGGEDITCSTSIPSSGINAYHLAYFGITAGLAYCS